MLQVLLLLTLWWDYNESGFAKIYDNLWDRPLYAVCVSPNCPHCQGIPSRFQMFANSMANNDEIIYTAIDVSNSTACQKLGARYLPFFVFARGTSKKYWLYPQFKCPLRWIEFVGDWGGPHLNEIKLGENSSKSIKDDEISEFTKKTLNGGSTFYLKFNSNATEGSDELLKTFSNLSTKYHIYNCTFIYSSNNKKTELIIYTSTKCSFSFDQINSKKLEKLIQKYRFSSLHHLDQKEWKENGKNSNSFILMNDGELNGTRIELLDNLANERCSDSLRFGWAILKDQRAISMMLKQKNDKPYVALVNKKNSCQFVGDFDENLSNLLNFVNKSLENGQTKCKQYVAGGEGGGKQGKSVKKLKKKFGGKKGLIPLALFALILIIVFVLKVFQKEQKLE